MSQTEKQRILEGLLAFAKKHQPPGLLVCERHCWPVSPAVDEPVIFLELPGGFSFGPICTRHAVAVVFDEGDIFVYNPFWLPQAEALAAEYEKYSGRRVKVTIFERRPS